MTNASLADRILDAQVRWILDQVTGEALPDLIARDVYDLLDVGSRITLDRLADVDDVKRVARLLAEHVPASTAGSTATAMAADVVHGGPHTAFTLADVVDREHVERIVDEVLGMHETFAALLDDLTRSPVVAAAASRFLTHAVSEVVSANRAVAEKIPGLGGLVSVGANVTGKVMGAADKQLEAMVGGTAAKGAQFAMKRLNKVLVETLKDPGTRSAVLEVFDLYAGESVPKVATLASEEDAQRIAGLVQDLVITAAASEPMLSLVDALIDGFFATYGEHPVSTLIEDLDLTRDDLVVHATTAAARVVASAHESGDLERIVRDRLAPFFASPELRAILEEA